MRIESEQVRQMIVSDDAAFGVNETPERVALFDGDGNLVTPNLRNQASVEDLIVSTTMDSFTNNTVFSVLVAPFALEILSVSLVNITAIAASDASYWTVTLRNIKAIGGYVGPMATKTTQVTGGAAFGIYTDWNFDAISLNSDRLMAKGDVFAVGFGKTGTPAAFVAPVCTLRYRPIGDS